MSVPVRNVLVSMATRQRFGSPVQHNDRGVIGELRATEGRPVIVSFDVFETVIVRAIGDPDALFVLLGTQLWQAGIIGPTPSQFAAQRHWAYVRARERTQPGDPSIRQIYQELAAYEGMSDRVVDQAISMELDLEERYMRPWNPGLELLQDVRRSGAQVVFTSDTYFPHEFVVQRLKQHVGLRQGESVLVSAVEGTSKRDGGLFDRLCENTGRAPSQVLHVGNDERSDVTIPVQRGICARPLLSGNLNRYEQTLERFSGASGGLTSLLAGASRLTRAELSEIALARSYPVATSDVVAGVLAPVLAGFVNWCLLQAERRGLTRLYFLAREGEPLLKMAQAFHRSGSGPELRYLYVSRQAINLSHFDPNHRDSLEWLLTDAELDTFPNLLARLGLSKEDDVVAICRQHQWKAAGGASAASAVAGLLACLRENAHGLRDAVAARARDQRAVVTDYLEGAGFLDAASVGLVDIAGVGSQLRSLATFRHESTDRGLLFNRYRPPGDGSAEGTSLAIDAYFSDGAKGLGFRSHPFVAALLELACASNDGTVTGYARDESGAVSAQLGRGQEGSAAELQSFVQHGLERFASNIVLDEVPEAIRWGDVRMATFELMERLWRQPTAAEVAVLAAFRLEVGSGVVERKPIVMPRSLSDLLRRESRRMEGRPWFYWHEGSMQRSSLPFRLLRGVRLVLDRAIRSRNKPWRLAR